MKFTGNFKTIGLWKHWFIDFGAKNWRHSHFSAAPLFYTIDNSSYSTDESKYGDEGTRGTGTHLKF
jgi:hypothetical protein